MKCDKCNEEIHELIPAIKRTRWLKLHNYFQHEFNEGEITEATYHDLTDTLNSLKPQSEEKEL